MTLGDIIKKYRETQSMSMDEFAKKSGLSKSYISLLERNRHPKTGEPISPSIWCINQVSGAVGMELNDVLAMTEDAFHQTATPPLPTFDNIFPVSVKQVPLLGEIACGEPIFATEDRENYVLAGTDIHADFCLKAKGDSMVNARIFDGDIVFIKRQPMVENGDIAAVIINDEATLKRVTYFKEQNMLILKPENPAYKDLIFMDGALDQIRILGKAIAFQSNVR